MTFSPIDEYGRPTKIKVGPHDYRVLYSKESWRKYAPKQRKHNYGMTISEQGVILLNTKRLNASQMRDTLLHEVMHTLLHLFNFENFPVDFPEDRNNLEEMLILLVTPNLLQVLRDNPEFTKWLMHE